MSERLTLRLIIRGRVQGVWFRDWTVKAAKELGLTGWVRNLRDGSVETHVEGSKDAIARYIELAYEGPPAADVIDIDASEIVSESCEDFTKRPTP